MTHVFKTRGREELEKIEKQLLAPYAAKSEGANGTRLIPEEEHPYRTAFQRDRDRIIHSRAFRRLKHKRQVFLIHSGDHYRTRLTHTMEVAQISRTIAKALGLNEELVEAIALGHDLGHTPFGHVGEVILNKIMRGEDDLDGALPGDDLGGFKHNYQSLRVVDKLEKKYSFDGLNLTSHVREGILKHTSLRKNQLVYSDLITDNLHIDFDSATTVEGQVVAIADEIAQRTHDLEDGIRAGFVNLQEIRKLEIVATIEKKLALQDRDDYLYRNILIKALINLLVMDVIESTAKGVEFFCENKNRCDFFTEEVVKFSSYLDPLQTELDQFINEKIIFKPDTGGADGEAERVIRELFKSYFLSPKELKGYSYKKYSSENYKYYFLPQEASLSGVQNDTASTATGRGFARLICDYIAGMTDNFALAEYERVCKSGR